MVKTSTFLIFIMIVIFFNFFAGAFQLTSENESTAIEKTLFTNQIKDKILTATGWGNFKLIEGILTVLSLPFIIIESLIFVLVIIGTGFSILPPIIEIMIFTPLGIIIILDYIIPVIRGN